MIRIGIPCRTGPGKATTAENRRSRLPGSREIVVAAAVVHGQIQQQTPARARKVVPIEAGKEVGGNVAKDRRLVATELADGVVERETGKSAQAVRKKSKTRNREVSKDDHPVPGEGVDPIGLVASDLAMKVSGIRKETRHEVSVPVARLHPPFPAKNRTISGAMMN